VNVAKPGEATEDEPEQDMDEQDVFAR